MPTTTHHKEITTMPTSKKSKRNNCKPNTPKAASQSPCSPESPGVENAAQPVPGSDPTPSTPETPGRDHDNHDHNGDRHDGGIYQPALTNPFVREVPHDRPSYGSVWKDSDGAMPVMKMTQACYENVMKDLARQRFTREQGGMLIGPDDSNDIVTHYVKDEFGHSTTASFTIDHETLNRAINRVRPAKMICVGLIHSHPDGIARPSGGDIAFLQRLFHSPRNHQGSPGFLFPIVCQQKLHPFIVDARNPERILPAQLVLI